MKTSLIDDLVGDIYARLYEIIVPELNARSNDDDSRDRMRVNHLLMDNNAPPTVATSRLNTAQELEEPAVRARPKMASKREIVRRAETLVAKQMPLPPTNKAKAFFSGLTSVPAGETTTAVIIERTIENREDTATKEVPSSVPGSVHDSADDESELSDIVEDEEEEGVGREQKPIFPGLLSRSEENEGEESGNDDTEEEMGMEGEQVYHGNELTGPT